MLRLIAKFITEGRTDSFFGTEFQVKQWLHRHCPESKQFDRLADIVRAINEFGQVEVDVETYHPPASQNLLPENYVDHEESEDPWPREM